VLSTGRGQFIAMGVSFALTVLLSIFAGFSWSWIPLLFLIYFVGRYFLVGTVPSAAMIMQMGNIEGAEKELSYTKKPEWLQFGMRPMFYFMKGMLAMQTKKYAEAERLIQKAVDEGLPQDDTLAGAYLSFSGLYFQKNNKPECKRYLELAKKIKPTMPELKKYIADIENALKANQPQANPYMISKMQGLQHQKRR
jgi:tetratricopeptide (TPR) repeat protein